MSAKNRKEVWYCAAKVEVGVIPGDCYVFETMKDLLDSVVDEFEVDDVIQVAKVTVDLAGEHVIKKICEAAKETEK